MEFDDPNSGAVLERLCGVSNWQQAGWVDDWLKLYRISYGVTQKSLIMCDLGIVHLLLWGPPQEGFYRGRDG